MAFCGKGGKRMKDILGNDIYIGCKVVYNNILNDFSIGEVVNIKEDKIQVKGTSIPFFVTKEQIINVDGMVNNA